MSRTPVDARGEDRAVEFPSAPSSVPAARHLVRDDLMARKLPSRVIDDSMLVVSELITNAVSHAQPLRVTGHAGSVRLRWTADPPGCGSGSPTAVAATDPMSSLPTLQMSVDAGWRSCRRSQSTGG